MSKEFPPQTAYLFDKFTLKNIKFAFLKNYVFSEEKRM